VNKNPHVDQWLMEIKYYFLWNIDLYVLNDQQIIAHKKSGIQTPFETVDMAYRCTSHLFNKPKSLDGEKSPKSKNLGDSCSRGQSNLML
jgi:hypothetical protein